MTLEQLKNTIIVYNGLSLKLIVKRTINAHKKDAFNMYDYALIDNTIKSLIAIITISEHEKGATIHHFNNIHACTSTIYYILDSVKKAELEEKNGLQF